jgi:hypothetical protein
MGTADRERRGAMRPAGTFPGRKDLAKDFWEACAAKLFTVGGGGLLERRLAAG